MSDIKDTLRQLTVQTFEELAMLLPDADVSAAPALAVATAFSGPISGRLVIALFDDAVLRQLAENMLGSEVAPDSSMLADALGETANVLCGNLLPHLGGARDEYRIAAPVLIADVRSLAVLQQPLAACTIGLDAGRAEVYLFTDGTRA